MGRQHRMTKVSVGCVTWRACALCLALTAGAALAGCNKDAEEQKAQLRRDVLRANNLAAERRKQLEAVRLTDDNGNLIPSTQRVAGVVLPRGFTPKFKLEHEAYFDAELPYEKVVSYFTEQLDYAYAEQPSKSSLKFIKARTKGDAEMAPVNLMVSPVPGMGHWSRIRILLPQPLPERLQTKAEIDAELAKRRQREMY
jgi:hypothetical protein